MTDLIDFPFNPYRWKESAYAQKDEKWKWENSTWDPIILRITSSSEDVTNTIDCPVCGNKRLYCHFVAYRLANRSVTEQKVILVGDRWFGCNYCQVQFHDYGEIPMWVPFTKTIWASVEAKEDAIRKVREFHITGGLIE